MRSSSPLARKAISGVTWLYAEYALQFLTQSIALVVLARLLVPEDFGVFAIGLMVVGIGETVFRFGLGPSIVQRKGVMEGSLEVAWTFNVGASIIACGLLATIVPWISDVVFHSPESAPATMLMLISLPLSSLCNPATILAIKEMRYRSLFFVSLPRNLIRYGGGPILAIWFPSYWALVVSYLLGFVGECLLSYVLLENRARIAWNFSILKELYQFSGWLQLNNITKWLSRYLDSFVVGSVMGSGSLGLYNRAIVLSSLPSQQINMVLFKVGFPLFAAIQGQAVRTGQLSLRLLDLAMLTYLPAIVAIILFGHPIVALVLGEKWLDLVVPLQILVCAFFLRTLCDVMITVLRSNGHSRLEFTNNLLRVVISGGLSFPLIAKWGMLGASLAVLGGSLVAVPSALFWSWRMLKMDWRSVLLSQLVSMASAGAVIGLFAFLNTSLLLSPVYLGVLVCATSLLSVAIPGIVYAIFRIGPFEIVFVVLELASRRIRNA